MLDLLNWHCTWSFGSGLLPAANRSGHLPEDLAQEEVKHHEIRKVL
jgi:hypothetical protein